MPKRKRLAPFGAAERQDVRWKGLNMEMLAYTRTMARYNCWMNERLYEHCENLSDSDRKLDRGAFFKSIHGTLNHLLLGDRVWMSRFLERDFPIESLSQELYADFPELKHERNLTDQEILAWAAALTPECFAQTLTYTSIVNPVKRSYPLWAAVAHFFNHQTHHRGQLTTLLSQCGLDPGVTDLIWLPSLEVSP